MDRNETNSNAARIAEIWPELLQLQVDFAFPFEYAFLVKSRRWQRATTVTDIGCGTGVYLEALQALDRSKVYCGVDTNADFLDDAKRRLPNVKFELSDATCGVIPNSDIVIARLLLQHIRDPSTFFSNTRVHAPEATIFVLEANDRARVYVPEVPELEQFFSIFRQSQGLRDGTKTLYEMISESAQANGYELTRRQTCMFPSSVPGNKEKMVRAFSLAFDLARLSGVSGVDYEGLAAAWNRWASESQSFTEGGVEAFEFSPRHSRSK